MTKEMSKINGIDVSECEHFKINRGFNCYKGYNCIDKECSNCYFKQLKRLQEENEKLKNKNNDLIEEIASGNIDIAILQKKNEELKRRCEEWAWDSVKLQAQIDSKDYQLNKYKEILKDIRDVIEMPKYTCKEFLYIRGKINEVLNDN